jgi:hypothetical protein
MAEAADAEDILAYQNLALNRAREFEAEAKAAMDDADMLLAEAAEFYREAENRALALLDTASGDDYDERVRKALAKAPEDLKLEIQAAERSLHSARSRAQSADAAFHDARATREAVEAERTKIRKQLVQQTRSALEQVRQRWTLMVPKSEDELRQRDAILSGINVLIESHNGHLPLLEVSEWRSKIRALSRRLQDSESGEAALFQHFGEVLRELDLTLNELRDPGFFLPSVRQAITDQDQHWLALKQTESLRRTETAEREAASAAEPGSTDEVGVVSVA